MSNFVHLHIHDEYSYLDSTIKTEKLVERAVEMKMPAVVQTNHHNIDGCVRLWNLAKSAGIKPILGCELYVVKDHIVKVENEKRYHITVLVKNKKGFANLCRLLTTSWLEGLNKKPRISLDKILEYGEGLIVLSGCSSSPFNVYPEYVKKFVDIFGEDFYFEIMPFPNDFVGKRPDDWYFFEHLKRVKEFSKKYNRELVMTNDVHYLEDSHHYFREVIRRIQFNKKLSDPTYTPTVVQGMSLKSREEIKQLALQQGIFDELDIERSLDNTMKVAERIEFELEKYEPVLPVPEEYSGINEHDALKDLCWKGLRRLGKDKDPAYVERLNAELERIIPRFTTYFLIVHEMVSWVKSNDILVGPGRGSVGGSLVAYALGITNVDPLKYDLLFERFISEGRIDLPDIDMDFEDTKRDKIIQHLKEKYGEYNVASVSTFSTLRGRMVIRDVGRICELPVSDVESLVSIVIPRQSGDSRADLTAEDAFIHFENGKKFKDKYPQIAECIVNLEGLNRQKGVHAAGVVVHAEDLRLCGKGVLEIAKEGTVVNWDKRDLEHFGFTKYDILGLKTLSVLRSATKMIKENYDKDIDLQNMEFNDPKVYEMLSSGETFGVFQFQSISLQKFSKQVGISNFKELYDLSALHRPSGIKSGMITQYERRKRGYEEVVYPHTLLKPILKDTYGLPIYQEQVMYILHMAGIPWKTVDYVRKIISKSQGVEQMLKFREMYVKGCLERGLLNEEDANKVFDIIAHFGSYGFNKSHCVAYSMLTYYTAWLKKYYPREYFCAYLIHRGEEELVLRELKKLGTSIKLPHVNVSDVSWSMKNKEIVCGLSAIKGLGERTSSKIVEERKRRGEYTSIEDFAKRAGVGKSVLELLSKAGALDGLLPEDMNASLFEEVNSNIPKISEKEKLSKAVEVMPFLQMLDVFGGYRRLVEYLKNIWSTEGGRITKSVEVDASKPFQEKLYLFGQLGAIKYGYRENVRDVAGTADNLGAAYVYLTDDDGHIMVVIPEDEVLNNQGYVASLGGRVVIVESFQKRRRSNVVSTKIRKMEDVSKGDVSGLPVDFFKKVYADIMSALKELKCVNKCSAVGNYVPIEVGTYKIMIVGEAPGTEENKVGRPFVGRAGKLLFDSLSNYGLTREMFCISNAMKCLPSATGKISSQNDVSKCFSNLLKREIEIIQPTVILCLGGTFAKLLGKKNITSCAGTVEWNENVGCFVVYCLHPASVLYHRENEKMFLLGVENFARLLCKEELIKVETGETDVKAEEQEYEYEYEE